jgi:hypothetical protein
MAAVNNSVLAESLYFVENGAGTYTGTVVIPAGATLIDVIVHADALWTASSSAALIVGDTVDDDGIYAAVDLKSTDLLAEEGLSFAYPAGQFGADVVMDYASVATIGASYIKRRQLSTGRTMQAKVTSVGAGTGGRTRVTFVYAPLNQTIITQ